MKTKSILILSVVLYLVCLSYGNHLNKEQVHSHKQGYLKKQLLPQQNIEITAPQNEQNYKPLEQGVTYSTTTSSTTSSSTSNNQGSFVDDVIIGAFSLAGAFLLLWQNERRTVKTAQRIKKCSELCISTNPHEIDPNLEGKVIHVTGNSMTRDQIVDPIIPIAVVNSISLERKCEMYQWVEIKRTQRQGENTTVTYSYEKQWRSEFINSSSFRDSSHINNSSHFLFKADTTYAPTVQVGQYVLTMEQKKKCRKSSSVPITQETVSRYLNSKPQTFHNDIRSNGNYILFSQNPALGTQVGDFRVSFSHVSVGPITIVAEQIRNTFAPWHLSKEMDISSVQEGQDSEASVGCCGCGLLSACCKEINRPLEELDLVYEENLDLKAVFKRLENNNNLQTTISRIFGWFLFVLGWYLIFSPIYTILGWFPLIGFLLKSIGQAVAGLAAFILGSLMSGLTIAISWIRYRPWIAIPLLLICSGGIIYIFVSYEQSTQTQQVN